jgi:hypothetical protein
MNAINEIELKINAMSQMGTKELEKKLMNEINMMKS